MKLLVVLSGAGISAESGLRTFRDAGGLWEGHKIEDVATPEAWHKNPRLVLDFYNERRKQALNAKPNAAHIALKTLETYFDVHIITQNVDNLHEQAGSTKVLHLHGELFKARSTRDPLYVVPLEGWELNIGHLCPQGSQLRPHIVWFGEDVPLIVDAASIMQAADVVLVIGTALVVYPAAGLVQYAPSKAKIYVIDPNPPATYSKVKTIQATATVGMEQILPELIELSKI